MFGIAAGVATFIADADGQLDQRTAPSVRLQAGYRFASGIAPELSFFYVTPVGGLAPGLRWWIPLAGRFRPWLSAHGGVAHVKLTSGDVSAGAIYGTADAGAGLDVLVARGLVLGLGGDWLYGNELDAPRDQPIPVGARVIERRSSAIQALAVRAGFSVIF